ncbi:MAG: flippase activity-associated protein Agl23, partial [Blastocatellia bacterium]
MSMENAEAGKIASRVSTMVFIAALIIGVWVRFERIEIKPLHHDEGVNAFFLLNLARQGNYRYNPENYHGPTLYYFALLPIYLLGERDLALRVVPAIFGVLTIGMVWLLRQRLGRVGTPGAALLMAVSTGLVYYSRDFIHEMIFGCLSLGIVTGAVKYAENRKFRYFLMSVVSTALLFATKETAMVTVAVLLLAVLAATVWDLVRRRITLRAAGIEIRQLLCELRPSLDFTLAGLIIFVFGRPALQGQGEAPVPLTRSRETMLYGIGLAGVAVCWA